MNIHDDRGVQVYLAHDMVCQVYEMYMEYDGVHGVSGL